MTFFSSVSLAKEDPIFGLNAAFLSDPRKEKVNLGIGTFRDSDGNTVVMECVRKAEEKILNDQLDKNYLPIEGNYAFLSALQELTVENRPAAAIQTIGGTSALRIGADFLKAAISDHFYIPDPTWPNHKNIFASAKSYPYYRDCKVSFGEMLKVLNEAPKKSIVIFHGPCQNPTGTDLSMEQWQEVATLLESRSLFPFFDIAYHGFGEGLREDLSFLSPFIEKECAVAYSCSKNFGLYGERVGMLAILTEKASEVQSQLKQIVRPSYSNPPLQGSRIVATILEDPYLRKLWEKKLGKMRHRIQEMRNLLSQKLPDFPFLINQKGLFAYPGFSEDQVKTLREKDGIYLPPNGRINLAGLNGNNLDQVVQAMQKVL